MAKSRKHTEEKHSRGNVVRDLLLVARSVTYSSSLGLNARLSMLVAAVARTLRRLARGPEVS